MHFDLPLDELQTYAPDIPEPDDFDLFWATTLAQSREYPLDAQFTETDFGLSLVDVYDTTFSGYQGERVKAWLILPSGVERGRLPCVVEFIGYTGGRGLPHERLSWSNTGVAHLIMDTRGQGGDTPDLPGEGAPGPLQGYLTRGIQSRNEFYYRRLFTDAVRAVETARSHPGVDEDRIGVCGASQGGGIALAVAALDENLSAVIVDVPFLCHYRRAATLVDTAPYDELRTYLTQRPDMADAVFEVLSYFDGANFARRATSEALFSVGLMDMVCPPSTVYAAHNRYAGPKRIEVYPFHGHDAYRSTEQLKLRIEFMGARLGTGQAI